MNNLPWFVADPLLAIQVYKNPKQYVVLDYETTNKDFGSAIDPENSIVLACWDVVTPDGVVRKSHFGDEYDQAELEKDIKKSQFIVAWNAKFELGWLKRSGIDLHDVFVYDGYLAEWVIQSNRRNTNLLNLNDSAQRYGFGTKLDLVSYLIDSGICPSEIPKEWLEEYCFKDVELTRLVFEEQRKLLDEQDLWAMVLTRNLTVPVLTDMEFNPQHLDKEGVNKLYEQTINEYQQLENELGTFTGGINLNSGKQKVEFFYNTMGFDPPKDKKGNVIATPKGQPKTDADTLALLKPKNKTQARFLELQKVRGKVSALLSKNLNFFKACVNEMDGKFYGIFNQGFTDTGRLSSSGRKVKLTAFKQPKAPQLQNLPRTCKYLFTTHDDEEEVWAFDMAQLEFRVAAQLGGDDVATQEIIDGVDIHTFTGDVLTENGEPGFKDMDPKERRQASKPNTFQPLYWGRGKTKAQNAYAEFFWNKYDDVYAEQSRWVMEAANKKWFKSPYGMRFYFPKAKMSSRGWVEGSNQIVNYPIQGLATGEMVPIALFHFWHYTRGMPVYLFNTVHDSIVARVNKSVDKDVLKRIIVQSSTHDVFSFLNDVYNYEFRVPLGVGLKIGPAWDVADVEEVWDVFPDGTEKYKVKD